MQIFTKPKLFNRLRAGPLRKATMLRSYVAPVCALCVKLSCCCHVTIVHPNTKPFMFIWLCCKPHTNIVGDTTHIYIAAFLSKRYIWTMWKQTQIKHVNMIMLLASFIMLNHQSWRNNTNGYKDIALRTNVVNDATHIQEPSGTQCRSNLFLAM